MDACWHGDLTSNWCAVTIIINHGLETYYWSCRSFEEKEELEEDDENAVCRISLHEADGGCWRLWDSFQVEDHSRNSVRYLKKALES